MNTKVGGGVRLVRVGVKRHVKRDRGAIAKIRAVVQRIGPAWLCAFARRRLEKTTAAEQRSLVWEALAFAKGRGLDYEVTSDEAAPTWAEVTRAHDRLWLHLLTPLKLENSCEVKWSGRLQLQPDGLVTANTATDGLPFGDAFLCQAVEQIRQQAARGVRLRFCAYCGRPFTAKRPDAKLCPETSCRTLTWRKANREKFRKARKRTYKRKTEKALGLA